MTAPPSDVALADRVVEVLYDRGADASPRWAVGSGLVVRGRTVLTAAHVVGSTGELLVRFRGADEWPARVCRLPSGRSAIDEQIDVAVLEIIGEVGIPEPVAFARLRDNPAIDTPNLDGCSAFGFPDFQKRRRDGRDRPVRELARVDGYIPMGQGLVEGMATLRVRDAPHDVPIPAGGLAGSPWHGISGAVVLCGGRAVGIISEHHPPAGTNALTVVPLAWLDRCVEAADWWELLGVPDSTSLPRFPADYRSIGDPALPDAEVVKRYRELVLQVPELMTLASPFGGLATDYYAPRLLRPVQWITGRGAASAQEEPAQPIDEVVGSVDRLVIVADAGMGKTELMHDLARQMAAGDARGVPVLVRLGDLARRGNQRDPLSFGVEELLGDRLEEEEVERIVEVLRRQPGGTVDGPVFLFDGLDEVPTSQRHEVLARVRKARRFILTSGPIGRIDVRQGTDGAYRIEELTDQAIEQFLNSWVSHRPEAAELFDQIADDPALAELARFPQLLTLLCWLWRPSVDTSHRSKVGILAEAVDEAFHRATSLMHLPEGEEEVVPIRARNALRRAALESMMTGDADQRTLTSDYLLDLMAEVGGSERAGTLLGFARRTGLIVPATGAGQELDFLHHMFRSFLAGEALVADANPEVAIARLQRRTAAEDALAVAAMLDPARMPALILDRLDDQDIFHMNWRLAALCMEGLPDLRPIENRLRPVVDAVLTAAQEWWSRDRFTVVMGHLGTAYMRGRLFESLSDEDAYVRWAAVDGLRYVGGPDVVPALIDHLDREEWVAIQAAAITALGRLRDRRAIPAICAYYERRCRTPDLYTNFHAVGEALGRLGAEPELRQVISELPADPAIDALHGAAPFLPASFMDEIVEALNRHRVTVSTPEIVERHLTVLHDDQATPEQRLTAVRGVGNAQTYEAAEALIDVLRDPSRGVRDMAAEVLRDLSGTPDFHAVVQYMYDTLTSPDASGQRMAAAELLALWTSPVQGDLCELTFPPPDPALQELIRHPDPIVRAAAVIVLMLGGVLDPPALLELVDSSAPMAREAAIAAAGLAGVQEATGRIASIARTDPDQPIRITAWHALARLGATGALDILTAALGTADAEARFAAVSAIAMLGDPGAIPALVRRLPYEDDWEVRLALIGAVIEVRGPLPVPPEITEAVVSAMDNDDATVRAAAVYAAGDLGLAETCPRLLHLMSRDPSEEVRDAAAEGYGMFATAEALREVVDHIAATGFAGEQMCAVATALAERDDQVRRALRERVGVTGGSTIVSERGVVVLYPRHTYILRNDNSDVQHEVGELLEAFAEGDPDRRWAAVDELADSWAESGVLGRLALAMLDSDRCVADRAAGILSDLSDKYQIEDLDAESAELVGEPATLSRLIGLLDGESADARTGTAWLLTELDFLPDLLRALRDGHRSVRQVLWEIAERYQLRLFLDGRAVLASGEEVPWDDLPMSLRRGG